MAISYTDYIEKITNKLGQLIDNEFPNADIKEADVWKGCRYPDAGTFKIQWVDGPTYDPESPMGYHRDTYIFEIGIYVGYKDKEANQKVLSALVMHLWAFLQHTDQIEVTGHWEDSEPTHTAPVNVGERVGPDEFRPFLRGAIMEWQCKVMQARG